MLENYCEIENLIRFTLCIIKFPTILMPDKISKKLTEIGEYDHKIIDWSMLYMDSMTFFHEFLLQLERN